MTIGQSGTNKLQNFLGTQQPDVVELVRTLFDTSAYHGMILPDAFTFSPPSTSICAEKYSGWLQRLGTLVGDTLNRVQKNSRYVVYPASGHDAASVTRAFPGAEGYVLINPGPFIKMDAGKPQIDTKVFDVGDPNLVFDYNFVKFKGEVWKESENSGGALPHLLSELKLGNPDMVLEGVIYFAQAPRLSHPRDATLETNSHGIIFYRPNPEANTRMLVYLDTILAEYGDPALPLYSDPRIEGNVYEVSTVNVPLGFMDTLLVKGSQGRLAPLRVMSAMEGVNVKAEERIARKVGRELMLNYLKENKGVIVEGYHANPATSEKCCSNPSAEVIPDEIENEAKAEGWKLLKDSNFPLSYYEGMRIWAFESAEGKISGVPPPSQTNDLLGVNLMLGGSQDKVAIDFGDKIFSMSVISSRPEKPVLLEADPRIQARMITQEKITEYADFLKKGRR